jgi:hypothetical protein
VTVDPDWLAHIASISNSNSNDVQENLQFSNTHSDDERRVPEAVRSDSPLDEEDDWSGDKLSEGPVNGGTSATLLNNIHSAAELRDQAFNVAPGEGNRPLGVISDRNFEKLAFPLVMAAKLYQTFPSRRICFVGSSFVTKIHEQPEIPPFCFSNCGKFKRRLTAAILGYVYVKLKRTADL